MQIALIDVQRRVQSRVPLPWIQMDPEWQRVQQAAGRPLVRFKDATGQSRVKKTLAVVDVRHIVGLEFDGLRQLKVLGVAEPPVVKETEYRPGTLVG